MPNAAPAAGAGTPVAGNHDNATEMSAPVEDADIHAPIPDSDDLGSHRDDEDADAEEPAAPGDQEPEAPVRLKGKPLAQVYKEFSGLEKDRSRLANELGETRALLRQALEQALKTSTPATADEDPDPTDEEFDVNPREAVRKAVAKATKPLEKAVATAEQRAAMLEFDSRHPGYIAEAASPDFQEWVKASPYRVRLFTAASKFDMDAAEDLFSAWDERKASLPPADAEDAETPADKKREQILRQKTVTGGAGKAAGSKSGKRIYKVTELSRLFIQDRERYNAILQDDPTMFAEKRVR